MYTDQGTTKVYICGVSKKKKVRPLIYYRVDNYIYRNYFRIRRDYFVN